MHSGVNCLSPYQAVDGADWYSGTANAIYQNINYIERYNPEYVVILSGDHIYKMDYNKMLEYHKEKNAACTIAVIDVSLEEASRFGILNTNEDGSIYEFEEKPAHPKSTNASMGIYIFSWKELKKYLTEADENFYVTTKYELPIASGMKIIVKNEENGFSLKDITINDKKIDTEKEYSILLTDTTKSILKKINPKCAI